MKKYLALASVLASLMSFAVVANAQTYYTNQTYPGCPVGYTCTPIVPQVVNCPVGYTCTPIPSNPPVYYPPNPLITSPCYVFTRNIGVGTYMTSEETSALLNILINEGIISSGAGIGNVYDNTTAAYVTRFQAKYGVYSTGYFGPLTRAKISSLYSNCNPTPYPQPVSSLRIISPNGGQSWQKGTTQYITWTAPAYFVATYADLKLVPYYPACTDQICPMSATSALYPYRAPYTIATNISINQNSYSWRVGDFTDSGIYLPNVGVLAPVPDGQYTIQICVTGTSNCDSSDSPFTISSGYNNGAAPVINSIDAPTTLAVGQTGTWTVRAVDPNNGTLSYSVTWGDENLVYPMYSGVVASPAYLQTTTFTHSYANAGTYTVTFTVRNSSGLTVQSSATVQVGNTNSAGPLQIISPNGGEYWSLGSTQTIRWTSPYYFRATYADLRLVPVNTCTGTYCTAIYRPTYTIASNISINQNSYSWIVGNAISPYQAPAGQYTIQICETGTSNCESSDYAFTIQ